MNSPLLVSLDRAIDWYSTSVVSQPTRTVAEKSSSSVYYTSPLVSLLHSSHSLHLQPLAITPIMLATKFLVALCSLSPLAMAQVLEGSYTKTANGAAISNTGQGGGTGNISWATTSFLAPSSDIYCW